MVLAHGHGQTPHPLGVTLGRNRVGGQHKNNYFKKRTYNILIINFQLPSPLKIYTQKFRFCRSHPGIISISKSNDKTAKSGERFTQRNRSLFLQNVIPINHIKIIHIILLYYILTQYGVVYLLKSYKNKFAHPVFVKNLNYL